MPNFKYRVRDNAGKSYAGVISGEDRAAVAKKLSTMGYIPTSIEETLSSGAKGAALHGFFKKVPIQDLNIFTRQMVTLQKSGVPLLSSLDILEKQAQNAYLKDVIKDVSVSVESGSSLSDALSKHPRIFGELYVNMIKAGEASGLLDEVLERLSEFGEKDMEVRNKVKSATRYPMITLGALIAAFLIVVNFVVPRFATLFAGMKATLPLPTRILLGLNYFFVHYWYLLPVVIGLPIFAFLKYINTKGGRLKWDSFKLKMPVFGPLVTMFVMERFARIMSILIRSGIPMLKVFEMVSRAVGNEQVSRTIDSIAANVRAGKNISEPMNVSGLFPPIVVQMVAVGEDTGKLDELLMKVSEYYEQQSDYVLRNLTTLIEPIFIVVLGGMVLVMALGIFLPMWNMMSVFQQK